VAAAPLPQGGYLQLSRDPARSVEAIRRVSERDAARWPRFCERMARLARFFEKLYCEPPPDPLGARFRAARASAGTGRTGRSAAHLPMSVAELLDDWFENDTLKGILGAAAVMQPPAGSALGRYRVSPDRAPAWQSARYFPRAALESARSAGAVGVG